MARRVAGKDRVIRKFAGNFRRTPTARSLLIFGDPTSRSILILIYYNGSFDCEPLSRYRVSAYP
jgi:hypothetical protein